MKEDMNKIKKLICKIIQEDINKGEFPYDFIKGQKSYLWEMLDIKENDNF